MQAPWHLWVIGVTTLLWHGFGAFDYSMTQLANEAYMANFTPEQRAYFDAYPAWAVAGWAFGVWGSVAGSVLILLRRKWATAVFSLALAGSLLAAWYSFVVAPVSMAAMVGPEGYAITAVIYGVVAAMIWYSRAMTRTGVLN